MFVQEEKVILLSSISSTVLWSAVPLISHTCVNLIRLTYVSFAYIIFIPGNYKFQWDF